MRICILNIFTAILTLFIATHVSYAQDYLVTTKGDTIIGVLKPQTMGSEKRVQVVHEGKKTVYPMFQIKAYSLKGELYHPVRTQNGYAFMKVIKPGYLTLYAFQMDNQTSYDGLFLKKSDGSFLEVPNLNFRKMITKFLEDCPRVKDSIETTWGRRDLDKIVDAYNQCIDERTEIMQEQKSQQDKQSDHVGTWTIFEEQLKASAEFDGKSDALDMVAEVKGKLSRGEKIPKFLLDGLRSAIEPTNLKDELDVALTAIGAQ